MQEDDRKRISPHNDGKSTRHGGFQTGTARMQHDRVARARSLATSSQISCYSLDSLYTKRESTEFCFNRFMFFSC